MIGLPLHGDKQTLMLVILTIFLSFFLSFFLSQRCEDDDSYTFEVKPSGNKIDCMFIQLYSYYPVCELYDGNLQVKDYCQETCGLCAALPWPPTWPNVCMDDAKFRFKKESLSCGSLYNLSNTRRKHFCKRKAVKEHCPSACRKCCGNNHEFTFYGENTKLDCLDVVVESNGNVKHEYCSNRKVSRNCRAGCAMCPMPR